MEAAHVTNPKEDQGHTLSWKVHGLCFLGCVRSATSGLLPERLCYQRTTLL